MTIIDASTGEDRFGIPPASRERVCTRSWLLRDAGYWDDEVKTHEAVG